MFNNYLHNNENTPESRPGDGYHKFENAIKDRFNRLVLKDIPLFKTNVSKEDLWDAYLENIPEEARQHYNCNECKHFITKFGSLVMLDPYAKKISPIWNEVEVPEFFKNSVKALRELVEKADIRTQFIAEKRTLGVRKTGEWTHLSTTLPENYVYINKSRLLTEGQVMAEKKEHFGMLSRALHEYSLDTVNKAITLLESNTLYRGDKVLGRAKWFKELKEMVVKTADQNKRKNIIWLAVAIAPTGYCAVKSSMIGSLLDDIEEGALSYDSIKRRFDEKMNPANYQRSQSDPTSNQLYEAEKVINKLGLADSLARRYAAYEELPNEEFLWKPKRFEKNMASNTNTSSVFGHLKAVDAKTTSVLDNSNLPTTIMTWDKFSRTILSEAITLEALVDDPNRFVALVTAYNPEAENIFTWNNPFSWYYHGGADAEMKKRIEAAGGKHENNIIRCSLMWEGATDLDLHCINPMGNHMYYRIGCRKDSYGGYLDLDMNGMDKHSIHPVENMRWADRAPEGHYRFYVNNYIVRQNQIEGTPYIAELEVNGQVYTCHGDPLKSGRNRDAFEFDYYNGQISNLKTGGASSVSNSSMWNTERNTFVKVKGIITSPNLWGEKGNVNSGNHRFFLLEDCVDSSEGLGRGFFNEMLKPELREIRKTLEAYTAQTPIAGQDIANACGLGFSTNRDWNLTLRVKTKDSTRLIKIDRFD